MCMKIINKATNPMRNCLVFWFTNYITTKNWNMRSCYKGHSIFTRKFSPSNVNSLIHSGEWPSYNGFAFEISKYKF